MYVLMYMLAEHLSNTSPQAPLRPMVLLQRQLPPVL